ncbi:hypothetical protein GCM10011390_43120 [Aureimonas endophytica]|uniref:Small metal-binding protein n=1 Tax=Aureimonas endophytica TaxID=2027858 RepID=A0A917EBR2_9HYPH|nr:DUF1059 domain-containing protein [Aureimonas endophytica]GGE19282.1 hypothetical protein GCM10011390_43120 [Aureimonas endophytica]
MFELNCHGVIPGCDRVIRAESQAEVFRRAVQQAHQSGVEKLTPNLIDQLRDKTTELPN